MKISITINTCNEASHLPTCVQSVSALADEILVCDMESDDNSADLARQLGCKVISHPRMPAPEPEARTAAIEAATGDWIFVVDPDMRIPAATAERVRAIVDGDEADIVDFYCDHIYFGRLCRHGHGSRPLYRKLFKKSVFKPVSRNIQTFWHDSLSGRVLQLGREHAIQHLAYDSVAKCIETHARYALREAEQAVQGGAQPSAWRLVVAPMRRFVGSYILRQGFRDGIPGLIMSTIVAWYAFLIQAHVWNLTRQQKADKSG